MTLSNARLWFRFRCQIIENIKGNRSSQWRDNIECRHCTTGEHESPDHLERCIFFRKHREGLTLTIRMHKLIFWRLVTRTLKDIKYNNKDSVDNNTSIIIPEHGYKDTTTGNRGSQPYPQGQGKAQPVSDRETCPRGCDWNLCWCGHQCPGHKCRRDDHRSPP